VWPAQAAASLVAPARGSGNAMSMFASMCTQPQRLAEAVAPVRACLVAQPPVSRWGLGYVQGGEVLLVRTPRPSKTPVDFYDALARIHSDCVIGQAVSDSRFSGTDNTPPFRFRRWMFTQDGQARVDEAWPALLERIPDYLRRNVKGKTSAELTFHVMLAQLHERAAVDDVNLPLATTRDTLAAAVQQVTKALADVGMADPLGNVMASNSRSLIAARLGEEPLYLRRLHVAGERRERDESFRGVLILSASGGHPGEGFEEVPVGSVVMVTRDLRVDLAPLASS
jgi:predicted glutamine amidotransferase